MKISRILVPTDFSVAARSSYRFASALGAKFGSKVTLLHVDDTTTFGFNVSRELVAYLETVGQRVAQCLIDEGNSLRKDGARDVDVLTKGGIPHVVINQTIDENRIDLLIVSRYGARTGKEPMVHELGKTLRKLIRTAEIPILVVPPERSSPETSFTNMVATTDFSEDSELGLSQARALAHTYDADLTVLHVLETPRPFVAIAGEAPLHIPVEVLTTLRASKQTALESIAAADPKLSTAFTIASDPAEGIMELVQQAKPDLIIIPSHGKGGVRAALFGSTSERILRQSPVPVLILPRPWLRRRRE